LPEPYQNRKHGAGVPSGTTVGLYGSDFFKLKAKAFAGLSRALHCGGEESRSGKANLPPYYPGNPNKVTALLGWMDFPYRLLSYTDPLSI